MNSYLLADQLLQYALNALTSFFLFSLLTEGIMWLFKIRNPRLQASVRFIPPLRIALEPLFLFLPLKPAMINASIFSCSHPLQYFLFGRLPETVKQELSLYGLKTLTGSFLLRVPLYLINIAIVILSAITLYRIATLIIQYIRSVTHIQGIQERGSLSSRPIFTKKLQDQLQKQQTKILISPEVQVPIASWGNAIIFPESLVNKLTQKEFESVISHELEHHLWRDTVVRMVYHLVAAVYWWVPMRKWLHKLENEQEIASDISVHRYKLEGLDLATALKKTVQMQHSYHYKCAAFARRATITRGNILVDRIKAVLNPSVRLKQNKTSATTGVIIILGLALILGFAIC